MKATPESQMSFFQSENKVLSLSDSYLSVIIDSKPSCLSIIMPIDFAKKCLRNQKVKSIFPLNNNKRSLRNQYKYLVKFATTERYRKSAVPYMQNLLNEYERVKEKSVRFKGF